MDNLFSNSVRYHNEEADNALRSAERALGKIGHPAYVDEHEQWPRGEVLAFAQTQALIAVAEQLKVLVAAADVQDQRQQIQLSILGEVKDSLLKK